MKKRPFLFLCTLFLTAVVLISWGVTGHRTIGRIAANHLNPQATAAVRELLGNETLADASTWADEVRNQPEYKHTGPWHYINLPLGLSEPDFEKTVKGMTQENVYSALLQQEHILGSTASSKGQKIEALKFIVHFIGDLHQPMHVSREEDKGGNTILVNYAGVGTNLHALWDSKLLDHLGLDDQQLASTCDHAGAAQVAAWQSDPLIKWIWESYEISSKLYAEIDAMNGRSIDDSYYQAHIQIVEQRIEMAGVRLAGVLNRIFANGLAASSPGTSASATSPFGNATASGNGSSSGNGDAQAAAGSGMAKTIDIHDAANHYNEYVQVCAKVYGYKALDNLTLVNLGAAYPDQLLTVVLRGDAKDAYNGWDGQTICVTGKIVSYKDKPEIVVTDPKMVVVAKL
jgi:S1/P1 Nuclease